MSEQITHSMNCGALGFDGHDRGECTCGLDWRIKLQTEQTMHNAWRKRGEEAEKALAEKEIFRLQEREAWLVWWKQLFEASQSGHYNPNAMDKLLHSGPKPSAEVEGW